MKSAAAIAFDYRPSRWLFAAIVLMPLLAIAAIASSGMPGWIKAACGIVACDCAGFALGGYWRPSVHRAVWQSAGHWRISDADGGEHVAELVGSAVRGAWIVLNLRRSDGRRLALILGPDNCDVDVRRLLRVRLARIANAA
jgi:toxin CptA